MYGISMGSGQRGLTGPFALASNSALRMCQEQRAQSLKYIMKPRDCPYKFTLGMLKAVFAPRVSHGNDQIPWKSDGIGFTPFVIHGKGQPNFY
jgi:hypothetical protein